MQALSIASRQILAGTPIAAELTTVGERQRLPEIIEEMLLAKNSERQGRVIDHDSSGSMEMVKSLKVDSSARATDW